MWIVTRLGELPFLVVWGALGLIPVLLVLGLISLPVRVILQYHRERRWFVSCEGVPACDSGAAQAARAPRRRVSQSTRVAAIVCLIATFGAWLYRSAALRQERIFIANGHLFVAMALEGWPLDDALCGFVQPTHALTDRVWAASPDGRLAAYHRAMFAKYNDAARYPWLPAEPDPPVPK
jgi:hypothetical protein